MCVRSAITRSRARYEGHSLERRAKEDQNQLLFVCRVLDIVCNTLSFSSWSSFVAGVLDLLSRSGSMTASLDTEPSEAIERVVQSH